MKRLLDALLILAVLAVLIAGAVAVWDAPRTDPPTPWASGTCPPSDAANRWCVR